MKTLLITSVGSLVGQNLLDCMEGRRQGLRVLGSNSLAASPNNFRCDAAFLAPPVAEGPAWLDFHAALIEAEAVDLVIPGRDDDVLALARLREKVPALAPRLMVGSLAAATPLHDKGQCARFALRHELPFAPTVIGGEQSSLAQAEAFWREHAVLVAKPAAGNGSRGVRLVSTLDQVLTAAQTPGLVLQPYFDPQTEWLELAQSLTLGIPLWMEVPERSLYGAQLLIDPAGNVGAPFGYIATQVAGRPTQVRPFQGQELLNVAESYGKALAALGWRGPCNLQAKQDAKAGLQVIELNGRFTGTSHARLQLGFDELGLATDQWLGTAAITQSLDRPHPASLADLVVDERLLAGSSIRTLEAHGEWRRGEML